MNWILIIAVMILCSFGRPCKALRCRTEDGPGEDELKKIARICMKKVGENDSNSYEDSRGSNEGNDNNDYYGMKNNNGNDYFYNNQRNENNNNNDYNNNYHAQSGNVAGENREHSFGRQQQSTRGSNGYQNWNGYSNGNDWNGNQSYGSVSGSMGNRNNNGRKDNKNNQTEHDRACFVHCFFHELKLTNSDDQPDKFKMLTVLTRSIRDVQLKQFQIDSIQECFHMIEHMDNYRRRNYKCDTAQTIANCLTERAKANCDDFADDVMIL